MRHGAGYCEGEETAQPCRVVPLPQDGVQNVVEAVVVSDGPQVFVFCNKIEYNFIIYNAKIQLKNESYNLQVDCLRMFKGAGTAGPLTGGALWCTD